MKTCTKCHVEQELGAFYKNSSSRGGLSSRCRDCTKRASSIWQKANLDKRREISRRWDKVNPEKARIRSKKWRKANADACRDSLRRWRANNPEQANRRHQA